MLDKQTVVMGLSGGLDSSTLLFHLLDSNENEVHIFSFVYGSKHNKYEMTARHHILDEALARDTKGEIKSSHHVDLTDAFKSYSSNLLKSGGPIPDGHYEAECMKQTVVPGRNSIFITIMAGYAESIGGGSVVLGVHGGDHHIYPDCRLKYIHAISHAMLLASDNKVRVWAPFIDMSKEDIVNMGKSSLLNVPWELTRTCYKDQELACGTCGSCVERLGAFFDGGWIDPIDYMDCGRTDKPNE